MQVIDRRGQPPQIKLTKTEAVRLQDAAYIAMRLSNLTGDQSLSALTASLRGLVRSYAPQWLEDEEGVPAGKQTPQVAPPAATTGANRAGLEQQDADNS
ncbi:MAG: hypothetical protein ACPGWS_01375 [Solirubrobacterales bacterium]